MNNECMGIGSILVRECLKIAAENGMEKCWLEVDRHNEKAIRFYEKTGFRFDGAEQTLQLGEPRTARRMLFAR